MDVRRLEPGDEEVLRDVRLAALARDPDAFASTLAREQGFRPDDWTLLLGPPSVAFVVGEPVAGLVWGVPDEDGDRAHVYGMWLTPALRGTGVADDLVSAVVAWARDVGCRWLDLEVVEGNDRAEAVYLRHGFVRTGEVITRPRDGLVEVCLSLDLHRGL